MPPKKIVIKPIIISKTKKMVMQQPNSGMFLSKINLNKAMFKEDVIYESENCDFLKGESQKVKIINRVNLLNKTCRTVARCTSKGVTVETTSDDVCALIGQKNYDTILSALSSVFNEETKVRGILALLKKQTTYNTVSTVTDATNKIDEGVQTMESRFDLFLKEKQKKRIRRHQFAPYIVQEKDPPLRVKRCVINVEDIKKETPKEKPDLPDLKLILDEDSNMSAGSIGSLSSLRSAHGVDLLTNCQGVLKDIDRHTDRITSVNSTIVTVGDGTNIMIPVKPQDEFHIATADILKNVTKEEGMKLIRHQADIDFKLCLEQDDDGYYPLHVAVLHNDVDLVRRQCLALRFRHESVDIPAGSSGLTALHMSIRQNTPECTLELLRGGADPLHCDAERRTALHLCADAAAAPLRSVLDYMDAHARQILKNNGDLWKPELESKSDEELVNYLHDQVSQMFDDQGYNPLMIASDSGLPDHVSALASRAPRRVDAPAPNCGSTALYRAVAAACRHVKESGNQSKTPENFSRTIETLVEYGADPTIENHCGSSVNTLLTEFNICCLSMTIANKMTVMNHSKLASNVMLYKDKEGKIGYKNINGLKEIDEDDVNFDKDVPTSVSKAVTPVEVTNDRVYKASKFIRIREGLKCVKDIPVKINKNDAKALKDDKNVGLKVTADKISGLKVIKAGIPLEDKADKQTDKVVIVDNVGLKKGLPKVAIASTSVVKPKNFVLKNPIKLTKVTSDTISIPSRLFKIGPVHVSNVKKRKLE